MVLFMAAIGGDVDVFVTRLWLYSMVVGVAFVLPSSMHAGRTLKYLSRGFPVLLSRHHGPLLPRQTAPYGAVFVVRYTDAARWRQGSGFFLNNLIEHATLLHPSEFGFPGFSGQGFWGEVFERIRSTRVACHAEVSMHLNLRLFIDDRSGSH
jgi:hypothetical protein